MLNLLQYIYLFLKGKCFSQFYHIGFENYCYDIKV